MPHLPDFEAWAIFAKVAERGSFSAAAGELLLSKATVSKAITRLEERIGAPLLHRTSRRLSLTETGRAVLARARRIAEEGEAIEEEAADRSPAPRGTVRLAAPMSFGIQHLGPMLPEFLARYPQVCVDLHLSDRRMDLVADGIDVALRIGTLADSSLRARRLFAIRVPLVAAPSLVASRGEPRHPAELESWPAINFSHLAQPELWTFRHQLEGEVTVRMEGRLRLDNGDVAVPALVAGHAIARIPEFLVWRELRDGRLVEILPEWSLATAALHIVTPPGTIRPARVTALIDFLSQQFRKAPWAYAMPEGDAG